MNPEQFLTSTLRREPWGGRVCRILAAALNACDPRAAVRACMQRSGDRLRIHEKVYDLKHIQRIWVVGAGKAGHPMAQAVAEILGDQLTQGVVITKDGYAKSDAQFDNLIILEAGHPLPDGRGVQGSKRITDLLKQNGPNDLVICLISGGGSALLVSPAAGLSLEDLQSTTKQLLACGANINEINTLRKHLENLKGGQLARFVYPAQAATLILSDVVGDPLDVIASGPTVPDPTTFADAMMILERYGIHDQVPESIRDHLRRGIQGEVLETPKPGEAIFDRMQNVIIGSNSLSAQTALAQAKIEGFQALLLTTFLQGEARQVGKVLAGIARQIAKDNQPIPRPACLIMGGETTVTLDGNGLGGRNQELTLAAAIDLEGLHEIALVSLATDGGDGPTDAAGAIATGNTFSLAHIAGLNPDEYLARHDAYHFFEQLGDLIKTGPTLTNVNDLALLFAF